MADTALLSRDAPTAPLPRSQVFFYALGHVLNDATAACWFSFLLIYLVRSEGLTGAQAGAVLFAGQLADAIATPLVGLASDASHGCPRLGLGRRKAWNAGGVVVVSVMFVLTFSGGGGIAMSSTGKAAALGIAAALFNCGWAAVQVSHMALVPELTTSEGERVLLNSARYAFTILSNVFVFLVMLVLLRGDDDVNAARYTDPSLYRTLAYTVLVAGATCSVAFLLGTREPIVGGGGGRRGQQRGEGVGVRGDYSAALTGALEVGGEKDALPPSSPPTAPAVSHAVSHAAQRRSSSEGGAFYNVTTWRDWLTVPDFWRIMAVYALVRLSVNCSQVYLSFFVTETLQMAPAALAITPLLSYVAQLGATFATRRIAVALGRRRSIFLGSLLTALACAAMAFVPSGPASAAVYPTVMLLGFGLALSMVVSVSMEADLVGDRTSSAAFVYGACSLADKLSAGIFILGIQILGDDDFPIGSPHRATFIRLVISTVPAVSAIFAALVAATISFPKYHDDHSGVVNSGGGGVVGGEKHVLMRGVSQIFSTSALLGDEEELEGAPGGRDTSPLLMSSKR